VLTSHAAYEGEAVWGVYSALELARIASRGDKLRQSIIGEPCIHEVAIDADPDYYDSFEASERAK
jgi:hypothetical protein